MVGGNDIESSATDRNGNRSRQDGQGRSRCHACRCFPWDRMWRIAFIFSGALQSVGWQGRSKAGDEGGPPIGANSLIEMCVVAGAHADDVAACALLR
jgi:hypothetical protein